MNLTDEDKKRLKEYKIQCLYKIDYYNGLLELIKLLEETK